MTNNSAQDTIHAYSHNPKIMKKQMCNIVGYVDMENVASTELALEDLMSALLRADDDHNCIFVIKATSPRFPTTGS